MAHYQQRGDARPSDYRYVLGLWLRAEPFPCPSPSQAPWDCPKFVNMQSAPAHTQIAVKDLDEAPKPVEIR